MRCARSRVTLPTSACLFAIAFTPGLGLRTASADDATGRTPPAISASAPALAPAASAPVVSAPAVPAPDASTLKPARPYWLELTVAQREALAPLADDWEHLDSQTKKKWVEISNRYPRMKPEEQTRTRDRMREWAMLTPDQRRVARDSYARIQSMPPERRAEMLRKYQELPPEKRQALASEGKATKPLIMPKPTPTTSERRAQMREGAKVRNPAVAAQRSASPVAARPKPAPTIASPLPANPSTAPSAAPPTAPTAPPAPPTSPTSPTPPAAAPAGTTP